MKKNEEKLSAKKEMKSFYFTQPKCTIEAETQEEAIKIFKKKYSLINK